MTDKRNDNCHKQYIENVVAIYLQLPDTPLKPSYNDRITASGFFIRQIPLPVIETALLLASLRRLSRNDDQPPLPPVRSHTSPLSFRNSKPPLCPMAIYSIYD